MKSCDLAEILSLALSISSRLLLCACGRSFGEFSFDSYEEDLQTTKFDV